MIGGHDQSVGMIGWLDCSSGVAGDMLLGALVDAGVPVEILQAAVDAVAPEPVRLRAEVTQRAGLRATKMHVDGTDSRTERSWRDVRALLQAAPLDADVADPALGTFAALAHAEASVHGTDVDDVHFHEVGALDAIADVVGVCAGLAHLGLEELHCSPVALGGGTARAAHGRLPVPGPAVVALLTGAPTYGGPVDVELTTPTGAALLATHVTTWGPQPPMRVTTAGTGAGTRELPGQPNVVRLLLGEPSGPAPAGRNPLVLETNVDDLDPRLWPAVLARLLEAGAADAWLTPILMKKGRPAHTLHVLVAADRAEAARRVVLTETSAIGLREHPVTKHALARSTCTVDVDGQAVRVKLAELEGAVVNVQPEFEDVAAAARALGRPVKEVLGRAVAAAWADRPGR
jgi:uncharacterized protein (TIGR00299 family) protein